MLHNAISGFTQTFILFILLTISPLHWVWGQKTKGVVTLDFTYNREILPQGKDLRQILENTISIIEPSFKILQRDNLSLLIEKLQEELNLQKDFNQEGESISQLKIKGADYLVVSNLTHNFANDLFRCQIDFINISGNSAFEKNPISFTMTRKQIMDFEECEKLFAAELPKLFNKIHQGNASSTGGNTNNKEVFSLPPPEVKILSTVFFNREVKEVSIGIGLGMHNTQTLQLPSKEFPCQVAYHTQLMILYKSPVVREKLVFLLKRVDAIEFDMRMKQSGFVSMMVGKGKNEKYPYVSFTQPMSGTYEINIYTVNKITNIFEDIQLIY